MPRRRRVVAGEFCIGDRVKVVSRKDMQRYLDSRGGDCRASFVGSMYDFCDELCEITAVRKEHRIVCLKCSKWNHTFWFDYEMVQKVEEVECYKSEVLDSFLEGVMIE